MMQPGGGWIKGVVSRHEVPSLLMHDRKRKGLTIAPDYEVVILVHCNNRRSDVQ